MKNIVIQTRINEQVKTRAEKVFNALGLTVNDGIRLFLNQVAIDRGLPFRPMLGDIPNEETIEAMKEADSGRGHEYNNVKALMKDIRG